MILKLIIFLFLLTTGCLTDKIHPYSMYGVGARIEGDHLLVTDFLKSPTQSLIPRNHTIDFQYPLLNKVISYIELSSNSNVFAEFILSVDEENAGGQILGGSVTAFKALEFYLKITVFGFDINEMPKGFQSILHPEIDLAGAMEPQTDDDNNNDADYYDDDFEDDNENVLMIGDRQIGDELIYETVQYSDTTDIRSNHSVQFYYIDVNYITLAKFTTLQTKTAAAIYSHVSEHSLKATIYDTAAFNLDVKLQLYGYKPENLPIDYYPPLPSVETHTILDKLNKNLIDNMKNNQPQQLNELINIPMPLSPTQITTTTTNSIVECTTNNGIKMSNIFYIYNIFIGLILIGFI